MRGAGSIRRLVVAVTTALVLGGGGAAQAAAFEVPDLGSAALPQQVHEQVHGQLQEHLPHVEIPRLELPTEEQLRDQALALLPEGVGKPAPPAPTPEYADPNYIWRDDLPSKVLAGKPHADYVLHRVPGSYFDAPRIPEESNYAISRGNSLYGPGTPLYVGEDSMCTLAVAGTDAQGRKVGITAGHCGNVGDPVSSADSWQVGPSGTIVDVNPHLDYAVIEFGSNSEITRSYNGVTVNSVGGAVHSGDVVCKHGVATGGSCAPAWIANNEIHLTQLCAMNGDSGAPVLKGDALVGFVSGGSLPIPGAHVVSCRTPLQGSVHVPTTSMGMDAVMADVNHRGGVGAGFKLPEPGLVDDNSGR